MILECECGSRSFTVQQKAYPPVRNKDGSIKRKAIKRAKVFTCDKCHAETLVYVLLHPESNLKWAS